MFRLFALFLAAGLVLGCPILDELDKGSAEMDKYSPSARKAAEEKKKADAAEKAGGSRSGSKAGGAVAGAKAAASQWWSKARTLAPDEKDEDLVRCVLPDGDRFMREHDCQMRSGVAKR